LKGNTISNRKWLRSYFSTLQRKGPHFIDEMNGILVLHLWCRERWIFCCSGSHGNYSIVHWLGWARNFYVASELKALEGYCTKIQLFPPGHYMTSKDGEFVQWYKETGLIMML
jgi:asparagine synthase (glutamine-hydrolysing)